MHGIETSEFESDIRPILNKTFQGIDEWSPLFTPKISVKRLVYPLDIYDHTCSKLLLDTISKAARCVGDAGCFFSDNYYFTSQLHSHGTRAGYAHAYIPIHELTPTFIGETDINKSEFGDLENYCEELDLVWTDYFRIYSEHSEWGLLLSFEHFGILGGSVQFMSMVENEICNLDEQANNFLDVFLGDPNDYRSRSSRNSAAHHIFNMLKYTYGEPESVQMLKNLGYL